MRTLAGIDSDKDGTRDDVQRFIAETWPQSERARKALTLLAQSFQAEILMADTATSEEARAYGQDVTAKLVGCLASVDDAIVQERALERVTIKVTNTPDRYAKSEKFNKLLHGSGFVLDKSPVAEQCGYDPTKLTD